METITKDRVRKSTPSKTQQRIDREISDHIRLYRQSTASTIRQRIEELDAKWDIERTLELNASLFALSGILLSVTVDRRWLWVPGVVTAFLAQHAIQGWCPPLPLFRKLGIRTRKELDKEKYALVEVLKERNTY